MNTVLGMKILVDIFWGPSRNWTSFRGHFYVFLGSFLKAA